MSEQPILGTALQGLSQATYLEGLDDQEFWEYAARLAAMPVVASGQIEGYLRCELHQRQGQRQAIFSLATLREVIPPPHHVTLLPTTPNWMVGLTAWRAEPIPVVDLDAYFSGHVARHDNERTLLVVQQDDHMVGLFVAVVGSLTALENDRLRPLEQAPAWYPHLSPRMVLGTYDDAFVLNMPELLTNMTQQMRAMVVYE